MTDKNINVYDEPISSLSSCTMKKLQMQLDLKKLLTTDEGFERDWRGLARLAGICPQAISYIASKPNPTEELFKFWKDSSLSLLFEYLRKMERCDIIEDLEEDNYKEQVFDYIAQKKKALISTPSPLHVADKEILTRDDAILLENGMSPQIYDAFLLYSDEDVDFAFELVRRMENENFKLFLKDRDLVGGQALENQLIMRVISERCNRLIVIISNNFLKSEANKLFVDFAYALGCEQQRKMIIPCLIEHNIAIPSTLKFLFCMDYTKSGRLFNFWEKLKQILHEARISQSSKITPTENPEYFIFLKEEQNSKSIKEKKNIKENKLKSLTFPEIPQHTPGETHSKESSLLKTSHSHLIFKKKIKKLFKKNKQKKTVDPPPC